MKKLFVIVAAVMFSSAAFAQDAKSTAPAPAATLSPAPAHSHAHADAAQTHGYYMMKDNVLMHCKGDAMTPVKADVTLKSGATITTKGQVTSKEGVKSQIGNGQCCDMSGHMGDCDKMKASMSKAEAGSGKAPQPATK